MQSYERFLDAWRHSVFNGKVSTLQNATQVPSRQGGTNKTCQANSDWKIKGKFLVLLHLWADPNIPAVLKELIFLTLLAAKNASSWKHPPAMKQWHFNLWDFMILDKIADNLSPSEPNESYSSSFTKWLLSTEILLKENLDSPNIPKYVYTFLVS